MPDENKVRDALNAAKGLVETVPVYQDALQPAMKEVGVALQTVAHTIVLVLRPLSYSIWGYEQIEKWLVPNLASRLQHTAVDKIQSPPPNIAASTIAGVRSAPAALRELYANLLATAMDANTVRDAHPAFAEILRQLSPDEAQILKYLYPNRNCQPRPYQYLAGCVDTNSAKHTSRYCCKHYSELAADAGCANGDLILVYIENLFRLGLLELLPRSGRYDSRENSALAARYEALEEQFKSQARKDHAKGQISVTDVEVTRTNLRREALRFTHLGELFCRACVAAAESA